MRQWQKRMSLSGGSKEPCKWLASPNFSFSLLQWTLDWMSNWRYGNNTHGRRSLSDQSTSIIHYVQQKAIQWSKWIQRLLLFSLGINAVREFTEQLTLIPEVANSLNQTVYVIVLMTYFSVLDIKSSSKCDSVILFGLSSEGVVWYWKLQVYGSQFSVLEFHLHCAACCGMSWSKLWLRSWLLKP